MTECNREQLQFQGLGSRKVSACFSGGEITSDAGALLVREVSRRSGILRDFSKCFIDFRMPGKVVHSVESLLSQRIYGLCLGYEDLNDHTRLRDDRLFSVLNENAELNVGASASTLNRLERTPAEASREYHKIVCESEQVEAFFIAQYIKSVGKRAPRRIILDIDATDHRLYGNQEGKFFQGYYGHYCYLPLYIFAGDHLLCAQERVSSGDGAAGALEEIVRIVEKLREQWPEVTILIRGDSGFARDALMTWCEENNVEFLFGLARNNRLVTELQPLLEKAADAFTPTEKPPRYFHDFRYQTLSSWTRARRVVGKAEHLEKGANPRFIVTSLNRKASKAARLYEKHYCQRSDMENRIKEQLQLFADRASCATMRANQLRMWFSAVAYLLLSELRRKALRRTLLEKASINTIRLRLLKIGAIITVSTRRIFFQLSSAFPLKELFQQALRAVT